jgi:hypothetical protein
MLCASAPRAASLFWNTTYAFAHAPASSTLPLLMAARRGMPASACSGSERSRTLSTCPYLPSKKLRKI